MRWGFFGLGEVELKPNRKRDKKTRTAFWTIPLMLWV